MNNLKTNLSIAGVSLALAAIPFFYQYSAGARMERELAETAELSRKSTNKKVSIRPEGTNASAPYRYAPKTASGMLKQLASPYEPRTLIRDLLAEGNAGDPLAAQLAKSRLATMSDEEILELLDASWSYPLNSVSRIRFISTILKDMEDKSPRLLADNLMVGNRYTSYSRTYGNSTSFLTKWAADSPEEAFSWYEEKNASGVLFRGLGDSLHRAVLYDLISGGIEKSPELAFKAYFQSPSEPITVLTGLMAKKAAAIAAETGDDQLLLQVMESSKGTSRRSALKGAVKEYAKSGDPDSGLELLNRYFKDEWPSSNGRSFSVGPDRGEYLYAMSQNAQGLATNEKLDWIKNNITGDIGTRAAMEVVGDVFEKRVTGVRVLDPLTGFSPEVYDLAARDELKTWISNQPPGQIQDASYATLSWNYMWGGNYEQAYENLGMITNPSIRNQMREFVDGNKKLDESTDGESRRTGIYYKYPRKLKF